MPLVLLLAFIGFQLLPLPPSVLKVISPSTYEVYTKSLPGWPVTVPYADLLSERDQVSDQTSGYSSPEARGQIPEARPPWMPLSLAPQLTRIDLLKLTAYGALFFLILCYPFRHQARPPIPEAIGHRPEAPDPAHPFERKLLYTILLGAFLVAALGFLNLFTWNGKVLWFFVPYDGGSSGATRAASPFISPDNFANYLALVFPLMITGAVYRTFLTPRKLEAPFRILCGFGAFIILCSLLLSLSRGGWIGAAIGTTLLFFFVNKNAQRPQTRGQRPDPRGPTPTLRRLAVSLAAIALAGALFYVGPRARQHLDLRLSATAQDTDLAGRAAVWRDSTGMVEEFPVLGVGLGAWPELFPRYQSPQNPGFWREAHNDYLEFLSETGVIGFILLAWFFWLCLRQIVRGFRNPKSEIQNSSSLPILAALVAGIAAMAVSDFFDFHLQIPANALLFTVFVALSLRLSLPAGGHGDRETRKQGDGGLRSPVFGRRAGALAVGSLAAWLLLTAFDQDAIPYPHNLTSTPPTTVTQAIERIRSYPAQADAQLFLFGLLASPGEGDGETGAQADNPGNRTPETGNRAPDAGHQLRAARAALYLDPNNTRARDLLAALLVQRGDVEEGLREVTRSVEVAPARSAHFYLAEDFLPRLSAAEQKAIEDGFRAAMAKRTPGSIDELGVFLDRTGRSADVAVLYEDAAAATDDQQAKLTYFLKAAAARIETGELEKAEDLYGRAAHAVPQDIRPYNELIKRVYLPQKKLGEARETVSNAVASGADGFNLYLSLADLARTAGESLVAFEALAAARNLIARNGHENGFDRYVALFQAAQRAGDRKLQRTALEAAARIARPSYRTFYRLGGLYARDGNFDRAAYYYGKATRLDPLSAKGFYNLALVEERNFRFDAARRAYTRALELDPKNKRMRERYEKFEQKLTDSRNAG